MALVNRPVDEAEQKELLALEALSKEELEAEHSRILADAPRGPDGSRDFKAFNDATLRRVLTIVTIMRKQKGGPPRTKAPPTRDEDIFG